MWRLRARAAPEDGWVHVLVLLEFQSGVDRRMALRVLTYTGLAWEESVPIMRRVAAVLAGPEHEGLRKAFALWARELWTKEYDVFADADGALRGELDQMAEAGEVEAMGSLAVERWKEQERQKEAQIFARGRAEGIALERRLLGSLATRRFGADTGERLSALLVGVSEPERLAAVGHAIIDCGTGAELLAGARRIAGAED